MTKSYTRMPRISGRNLPRLRAVIEVLSGELSVSAAARQLKLSRNHFQAVMHRGLKALVEALGPRRPGRPGVPSWQRKLREESESLKRENERLRKRVETTDRVLALARGLLTGRQTRSRRAEKARLSREDE